MPEPDFKPVSPSERIELLDILRGFALLGVLYVNMHNFGSGQISGPVHSVAQFFMLTVFESKFFSLFSLLFGMGFAIQLGRAEAREDSLIRSYWRRLVVLFLIGWLHATIYQGDIVRLYAVLGFLLFPLKKLPPRHLLALAMLVIAIDYASWLAFRSDIFDVGSSELGVVEPADSQNAGEVTGHEGTDTDRRSHRIKAFKEGSFLEVVQVNLAWHERWTGIFVGYGPSAMALFLLGFAIIRMGIIDNIDGHRELIHRTMWWMLFIGLPGAAFSAYVVVVTEDFENASALLTVAESALYSISYPTLALCYASFIALYYRSSPWNKMLRPLAAPGRMALTVYVGQSVVYTTIYYGYGFGLYGKVGPTHIIFLTALIYILEVIICNWWLGRFRFGPLEWLWRSATYWKWQRIVQPSS